MRSPRAILSSRPGHRPCPSAPGLPSPSLGPPGALAVALACEGRLALTARPVGSAAPSHIPGDLRGTRGAEGYLRDGGFQIGMEGEPLSLVCVGGRPKVILGGLSHLLIIKSNIETMAPESLLIKWGWRQKLLAEKSVSRCQYPRNLRPRFFFPFGPRRRANAGSLTRREERL